MAEERLLQKLPRDNQVALHTQPRGRGAELELFRHEREAFPVPNRHDGVVTIKGSSFLPENAGWSDGTGATAAARSPWCGHQNRSQSRYNAIHEWALASILLSRSVYARSFINFVVSKR
jgi:hypothetical protein